MNKVPCRYQLPRETKYTRYLHIRWLWDGYVDIDTTPPML